MSLPTPYYDKDGITIYTGADRVILPYGYERAHKTIPSKETRGGCAEVETWPQAWVQAISRAHCEADKSWRTAPELERGGYIRAGWAVEGSAMVPSKAMRVVRGRESRAPSYRRKHCKQRPVKYPVCLPKMSYGGGWAS